MIRVHHLDRSRSIRVLWLLEELGLDYDLVQHWRNPETRLAPPSLAAIHPLGKAPMIEDDGAVILESGAIIDYVIRRHGGGRLAPDPATRDYDLYQMWLHYGEGSAMLPLMLDVYASAYRVDSPHLRARIDDELARHLGYVEESVTARPFLVGDTLTGADIQMAFVGDMLDRLELRDRYPAIAAWRGGLQARTAFARAVAKGGAPL